MIVPDLLFDLVLFGALLLALLLDNAFAFSPQLHGAASLLAVGLATYLAAQEMGDALERRRVWTQESLATALAISMTGFIYYFARNDSDLALVGLSGALMMTSLMVLISIIAAVSAAWSERSANPILGLFATTTGALMLGALSGLLVFVLTSGASLGIKVVILLVGALASVVWRRARSAAPNQAGAMPTTRDTLKSGAATVVEVTSDAVGGVPGKLATGKVSSQLRDSIEHPGARWTLTPQRGRLLDRLLPVLLLSALFFLVMQQSSSSPWSPASPAVASSGNVSDGTTSSSPSAP